VCGVLAPSAPWNAQGLSRSGCGVARDASAGIQLGERGESYVPLPPVSTRRRTARDPRLVLFGQHYATGVTWWRPHDDIGLAMAHLGDQYRR
jgi:hypothetical protein